MSRAPGHFNAGLVARDTMERGEVIWVDYGRDARTDINDPEMEGDLTEIAITADRDNLYVRAEMNTDIDTGSALPVQLQLAIDFDRVEGSGQEHFAGFSDTTVASNARWEILLQTQMQGLPSVRVWNSSFTVIGAGSIAVSGRNLEMAVPWSVMNHSFVPVAARMTVAVFRESPGGDVVDIGGPSVPDAIDLVSDFGTPGVRQNTWDEFDSSPISTTIDHWLALWFDSSGEAMAPVVVTRFRPTEYSIGGQFVELTAVSVAPLERGWFAVGDAQRPGSIGEGMFHLPPGIWSPASRIMIAREAQAVLDDLDRLADFETFDTHTDVPELEEMSEWATGMLDLAPADELMVLGPHRIILDVVSYNSGAFAQTSPLGPMEAGEIASRIDIEQDTDHGNADFQIRRACAHVSECPACFSCYDLECRQIREGSICTPSLCAFFGRCDAAGVCQGGVPRDCNDDIACTVDSCDLDVGCVNEPMPKGAACGDEDPCNGVETCSALGECEVTAPEPWCFDASVGTDAGAFDDAGALDGGEDAAVDPVDAAVVLPDATTGSDGEVDAAPSDSDGGGGESDAGTASPDPADASLDVMAPPDAGPDSPDADLATQDATLLDDDPTYAAGSGGCGCSTSRRLPLGSIGPVLCVLAFMRRRLR